MYDTKELATNYEEFTMATAYRIMDENGVFVANSDGIESVLTSLLAAGYMPNHSCGIGLCRCCETTLFSGEVRYDKGFQYSPEDTNTIYICSCSPTSDISLNVSSQRIKEPEYMVPNDPQGSSRKESFLAMRENSRNVANNRLLVIWKRDPLLFNFEQYNVFMQNMMQRLTPTVHRLKLGLGLLEAESSPAFASLIDAFKHNISDESGDGVPEEAHANLLRVSAETYSSVIYETCLQKRDPIPSTWRLHHASLDLFSQNVYEMLGAAIAQECHALPQLENMFDACNRVKDRFDPEEWDSVRRFYDIHLDGTEARHAEDLNDTVWDVLDGPAERRLFFQGYNRFCQLQASYWSGLHEAVQNESQADSYLDSRRAV